MRLKQRANLKRLFLLVVGCFLFALLCVMASVKREARVASVLAQAQNIYRIVYRAGTTDILPSSTAMGNRPNCASSTDYFRWLVSNRMVKVNFAFFAAPGISAYSGSDPSRFLPANNAWCVTADLAPDAGGYVPLLFTRNLAIDRLIDAKATALQSVPPFGKHGVVVLYNNGRAAFIRGKDLEKSFNPLRATNVVLRP